MAMKFNKGGYPVSPDNSTIGRQINDKFWSRAAVIEAKKIKTFSQLGDRLTQPKHYGDTIVKYHELPILDKRNINDQGIDAGGLTMNGRDPKTGATYWYAFEGDGITRIVTGATVDKLNGTGANQAFTTQALAQAAVDTKITYDAFLANGTPAPANPYATQAAAVTAAGTNGVVQATAGTVGQVKTGDGNLFGGSKDIAVQNGSFPVLTEEGGMVNRVGMKRLVIEAKVAEFGFYMSFTKRSLEMDTEKGLLARYSKNIGEAQGDVREAQIRNALIGQSEQNRVLAGGAATISDIDDTAASQLTFKDLRMMDKDLKDARCPKSTKLIDGSTKYGTATVGKARYVYVGMEALPTLEDMEHKGKNVWTAVEDYAAAGTIAMDEIGRIGPFRFIEVEEMPAYAGQGKASTSTDVYTTNGKVDVFPILFIGSGSFATVGFEGDVARVTTIMPKADAWNDVYGKKGAVSISWYFGMMYLHPEWIRQIACSMKVA